MNFGFGGRLRLMALLAVAAAALAVLVSRPPRVPQPEASPAPQAMTPPEFVTRNGCLQAVAADAAGAAMERADDADWTPVRTATTRLPPIEDRCGTVWLEGGGLRAFWNGNRQRSTTLAFTAELLKTVEMPGIAALEFSEEGEPWVLTFGGDVYRWRKGRWEKLPRPDQHSGLHRRGGLVFDDGVVWLASGRLYRWDEAAGKWAAAGLGADRLWLLSQGLLVARGGDASWLRWGAKPATEVFWRGGQVEIAAAAAGGDDDLWLGTDDGLVHFDADGRELARELRGVRVNSLSVRDGRVWVATARHGLYLRDADGRWHVRSYATGAPTDRVAWVHADGQGQLWIESDGVRVVGVRRAVAEILAAPPPPALPARHFADACAAAQALKVKGASGEIAAGRFGGTERVWFGAEQVCAPVKPGDGKTPSRITVRHRSGALVEGFNGYFLSNYCPPANCQGAWRDEYRERIWGFRVCPAGGDESQCRSIPAPEPTPAASPFVFRLDDRGRLWVSGRDGLYRRDGDAWQRLGIEHGFGDGNLAWAMAEDHRGTMWIASHSPWDVKRSRHPGPNVLRDDGARFRTWSPEQGIGYWSASDIVHLDRKVVAVATNGGLSLIENEEVLTFKNDVVPTERLASDGRGGAWIVNGHRGAGLYHFRSGELRRVTTREGLHDNHLDRVAVDGQGRVWTQAAGGAVTVYDPGVLDRALQAVGR